MRLIERFVCGKRPDPELCEDAVLVSPHHAVVVDGATDKTNRRFSGRTGGRFAAEIIAVSFENLDAAADLLTCVEVITANLLAALRTGVPPIDPGVDDGPTAVFVAYSVSRKEVWRVGDCSWASPDEMHVGRKEIDHIASDARAAVTRGLLLAGETENQLRQSDPGREMILPLLRVQHRFRNMNTAEPLAYGAIDGRSVPATFLETWPVSPGTELVLATDGYPALLPSLAEAEQYLAEDLVRDPLRVGRHPSTKGVRPGEVSFDDRAYIRLLT